MLNTNINLNTQKQQRDLDLAQANLLVEEKRLELEKALATLRSVEQYHKHVLGPVRFLEP